MLVSPCVLSGSPVKITIGLETLNLSAFATVPETALRADPRGLLPTGSRYGTGKYLTVELGETDMLRNIYSTI